MTADEEKDFKYALINGIEASVRCIQLQRQLDRVLNVLIMNVKELSLPMLRQLSDILEEPK